MQHNLKQIRPVLLCGGHGTRLAPLSTPENPKPFLHLLSEQYSMLQQTALRVKAAKPPLALCSAQHANRAQRHLNAVQIEPLDIIQEPALRNTAPAAALAAEYFKDDRDNEILLFLPCDHEIQDLKAFHIALITAVPYAEKGDFILFGEIPSAPDTGYGYIQAKAAGIVPQISAFHEKPTIDRAMQYLSSGYYWNCGIVMVAALALRKAFAQYCREISRIAAQCDLPCPEAEIFKDMPNISLDYALLGKVPSKRLCPVSMSWRDIGTLDKLKSSA